jgi:hypothetical protein
VNPPPEPEQLQPWQQQPGESDRWYGRFHRYLLLGGRRSLLGVVNAERLQLGQKKTTNPPTSWREAFLKWNWAERSAAWDKNQQAGAEKIWVARRDEQRQREWEISQNLMDKAQEILKEFLAQQKYSVRDAAALAETASKLARASAELWGGDLNGAIALVKQYGYEVVDPRRAEENIEGEA